MDEDPEVDEVTLTKLTEIAELTSHAEALGHVSLAWTRLHEIMAMLFGLLLQPVPEERAYAIWHSIKNDRSQRDMLLALTEASFPADSEIRKAIKWARDNLLSLENSRNDALHSPYLLIHDEERGPTMVANEITGNKRAANLSGRDLGVELESYKRNVTAVADYLWEAVRELSKPQNALAPQPHKMPPPSNYRACGVRAFGLQRNAGLWQRERSKWLSMVGADASLDQKTDYRLLDAARLF